MGEANVLRNYNSEVSIRKGNNIGMVNVQPKL